MRKTTKEILAHAVRGNYAVAAVNVENSVEINAVIEAAEALNAPLILETLPCNIGPCPQAFCDWILERLDKSAVPIALGLDDEKCDDGALFAIRSGASSLSVNRAFLPFWENVEEVRKLTAIAHGCGVAVEARLEGNGPEDKTDAASLTSPSGALRLMRETNADCLAISIHTPDASGLMQIDFDRLFRIRQAVGAYPLTLHGALGIPAKQLQKACHAGITKVNFSKDIKIAAAQAVQNGGAENVFALAKNGIKERLSELILLCGSDRKGTY